MTTTRRRGPRSGDALAVAAVDAARAAAIEVGGADAVGAAHGHDVEGDRVVTHYFECELPGYAGWRWSVTVVRASRAKVVTIDDCVLVPAADAVLAPAWIPWDERVTPDDLGPGDLLPVAPDDFRLVPGYTTADNEHTREVVEELGLGREWVLSREGRDAAAQRWHDGAGGPATDIAKAAPGRCATCAFAVPVAGSLGHSFGVCTNERTPFDGTTVDWGHGCGGHSDVRLPPASNDIAEPVVDTLSYELVSLDE